MSAAVIGGAATGVAQIIGSTIGSGQRKARQAAAQQQANRDQQALRNQEIVDPFENIENLQEEGVVDTRAAEFQSQQQQQNLSNVLGNFQQSSGAGIAGSAQALAGAALNAGEGSAATISQQVQQNQQARRAGAQSAQQARAQGKQYVQDLTENRNRALVNLSQGELDSATAARQQSHQDLLGGIGQTAGAVAGAFA